MRYTNFFKTLCLLVLLGCEKKIDFNLDNNEPSLVVEATIENDQYPEVVLTRSFSFFANFTPQMIEKSFVHNAEVFIASGSNTHQLKEYSIQAPGGYKFYYYTVDSANLSSAFKGKTEQTYNLRIRVGGSEYTAQTTIPVFPKDVDSLWWKPAQAVDDTTKVIAMAKITDPPGFGNYVRYFTKRNKEPFYPGLNSVFDDQVIDGTTYEIPIEPGLDRNVERDRSEGNFFRRGDTVTFKLSGIDKATYDFWRTIEYNYASIGNPFSTPIVVLGNIKGGALGYFGGYASQYYKLIIPE